MSNYIVKELVEHVTEYLNPLVYFNNKEITSDNDISEIDELISNINKITEIKITGFYLRELIKTYPDLQYYNETNPYVAGCTLVVNKFMCKFDGYENSIEINFKYIYREDGEFFRCVYINSNILSIDKEDDGYYLYGFYIDHINGLHSATFSKITEIKKVD